MTEKPEFDPAAFADAAALLLGIDITEYRRGVEQNLLVAAEMAKLMEAIPLHDEAEPGPVFTP